MNPTALKSILLAVMAIVSFVCGVLPIGVMKYLTGGSNGKLTHRASLIISLISCFAGGVFLGVCFLDIMPDALDAMQQVQDARSSDIDYPIVPLVFCLGFFFVYIFEEISGKICGHAHEDETLTVSVGDECGRQRAETFHSIVNNNIAVVELGTDKKNDVVKSLTLVVALLFHCGLEGFAFGVQDTTVSIISLFFGIIVHKAVVFFSMGMRLVQEQPKRPMFVVSMVLLVAVITPVGGAIGIIVEESDINETAKNIVTMVLLSFSLGTFIYITFFEILCPEHSNRHSNLAQWLASFIGFTTIALLMIVSN